MRFFFLCLSFLTALTSFSSAFRYESSSEKPPVFPREFRGVWVACVYNIDWPSKAGLSQLQQKKELYKIVMAAADNNLNAILFQVRPNADAVYRSSIEPYSHWLTGEMGKSPGYDPLKYCINLAHKKGIEVHAWFNPFRALPNDRIRTSSDHITRTHKSIIRKFRSYKWIDPASSFARQRALDVILDVATRYDVDGIHIDDYFYPYPKVEADGTPQTIFPDGKTPAQRRVYVDNFVKNMYQSVKAVKPFLRVGISPFGIWQPGYPKGIKANVNSYTHLSSDSRKWLREGWCDYMAPQLYWRIKPVDQSYSKLLRWWRAQSQRSSGKRPVWPGIATSRVMHADDPGRPASEIINQVKLSRTIGRNWAGHFHWSMKSLLLNKDNVTKKLKKYVYRTPALVPPMPWMSTSAPGSPKLHAQHLSGNASGTTEVRWNGVPTASKYTIQAKFGKIWYTVGVTYKHGANLIGRPDAIAISAVDRYGNASEPTVVRARR